MFADAEASLLGAVYTLDGQHCVVNEQSGEVDLAKATEEFGNELGCALGQKLLAQGAAQILAGPYDALNPCNISFQGVLNAC